MKEQIETVKTGNGAMEYFRFGEGEKIFVILPGISVKSVMESADAVAKQYEVMDSAFTTYVFDRRDEMPEHYSVRDMARDTAAAMKELGLTDVYLFGASQGGMIAMVIAAEHPELVRALVLGSTSAEVTKEQYAGLDKWLELARRKDGEALCLAFGRAIYPKEVYEQFREFFAITGRSVTGEELERFIKQAEGTEGFNAMDDLPKIKCPVLILGAKDDAVLGAESSLAIAEKLKDRKDCECFMYEGYGHAAFDTAPDYRERILRFFKNGRSDDE